LDGVDIVNEWIKVVVKEREILAESLLTMPQVVHVTPSDVNCIFVMLEEPSELYNILVDSGVMVRDRSKVELCGGCLRFTIGTTQENNLLLRSMREFYEDETQRRM